MMAAPTLTQMNSKKNPILRQLQPANKLRGWTMLDVETELIQALPLSKCSFCRIYFIPKIEK